MTFADYRLEKDGVVICDPCLCISLFSDLDLGPTGSPDMLGPYRAFLELFQNEIGYCRLDGNQMHPKRVTSELLQIPFKEMQDDKRRRRGGIMAEMKSGNSSDDKMAPSFYFKYSKILKPHTSVRICMSLSWFATEGLDGVRRFIEKALSAFHFQAGYVGYCFEWSMDEERVIEPYFLRWLQRHPGLMEPMFSHSVVSHTGLTDLGWITLLGPDFVSRLGGLVALEAATAHIPGVAIERLPGDAIGIRIGESPRLGDTQNGDAMEDYRSLGRVLAPLRNRFALHGGMSVAGINDNEFPGLREKWIDRFFPT